MSNFFALNFKDVFGALTSAVLVAVIGYVASVADIFSVDWHQLVNIAVLAALASLLKSLGTSADGKFLKAYPVK